MRKVRYLAVAFAGAVGVQGLLSPSLCHASPMDARSRMIDGKSMAFVYPVMGPRMSGDFGSRRHPVLKVRRHHHGIDLAAPKSAPIRAIAEGQVVYADPHGGYGRYIVVRHSGGYTSHYGHCEDVKVTPGQRIKTGEIIGTVGSSGISTGPHLHFEIRKNGIAQDPEDYLPGLADRAAG